MAGFTDALFPHPAREFDAAVGEQRRIDPVQANVMRGLEHLITWWSDCADELGRLSQSGQPRDELRIILFITQADGQRHSCDLCG